MSALFLIYMRKTFLLGGYPFTAPEVIGAGVRARAAQITTDIAEEKKVSLDTANIISRYYYDYSLKVLELLLIPSEGSPTVKEAYDLATDKEVQSVMSFFLQSATGKTKSAHGKQKDSSGSKGTLKQKT